MNYLLLRINIIFCLLLSFKSFGQVGYIEDIDGYTNVRKESNINSEIIYKVSLNEVFFIDLEYSELEETWIKVWIPKDRFSLTDKNYNITGFIHKSRIRLLDDLPLCKKNDINLTFEVVKADSAKIENDDVFGLEIPISLSYRINKMIIEWKGEEMIQKDEMIRDLYNVHFNEGRYKSTSPRFTNYLKNGIYFIYQKCADGAGSYEIVWVIKNGKIIQRLVGSTT